MRWTSFLLVVVAVAGALLLARRETVFAQWTQKGQAVALASKRPIVPVLVSFEETVQKLGDKPESILACRGELALRADGSTAERMDIFAQDGRFTHREREIKLRPDLFAHVLDDLKVYSVEKAALPNPLSNTGRLDPISNCTASFSGQQQFRLVGEIPDFLGYRAVRLESVNPNKTARSELWKVPELGCLQVRRNTTFLDASGASTDTNVRTVTSIRKSEPPAEMFRIPSGYTKLLPSERVSRLVERFGGKIHARESDALKAQDEFVRANPVDITPLILQ